MMRLSAVSLALGLVLGGGLLADQAQAHPHEFVEMKTRLQFNEKGEAVGLHYFWRFDEFFSAYALEPAEKGPDGNPTQAGLDTIHAEIMGNIHPISYFTKFDESAGLVPEFGNAKPIKASFVNRQMELTFEVPFKQPLQLSGKALSYSVYDEEFFIAMNHSVDADAVTMANAPGTCEATLEEANPDKAVEEFAASLGREDSAGTDLGINFAEWVTVKCR